MPTIEAENIIVELEVYCNTCNKGLCSVSEVYTSLRGYHRLNVKACPNCMEMKNIEIEYYQHQINKLEKEIDRLK